MGLIVHVLKTSGEEEMRTLIGEGPFTPTEKRPAVIIAPGPVGQMVVYDARRDADGGWVRDHRDGYVGPMANGRYITTSDSRFPYPPLMYFDRWETPAQYAALSV